jgi:tricorn protease
MRKILFILILLWTQSSFAQQASILFIQQPSLSPDGQWVAFEYKGNIYKVSSTGGNAIPLTINNAYNGYPVWSHDGKNIAFASDRYGNFDVFIMPSAGGTATRLTYNSAKDIPYDFSQDNRRVYFGTDRHDITSSVRFPEDNIWMKLYAVPATGGQSLLINSAGTEYVHFNNAGDKFIFQDRKGYENPWRKHHTSAVTRDIWVYNTKNKTYKKLTDFEGEDREPVWGDGSSFYYLSERAGNQNLFKSDINSPTDVKQLTSFDKNPVRNLSRSQTGLLAFTQSGEFFTLKEGSSPQKIVINLSADFEAGQIKNGPVKSSASEMAVSLNGEEVAYISHGEIFVAAVDGSETKRITNTPNQEKMIQFSPDGRSLLYSVEINGSWDIYKASIARNEEPYFYAATVIKTEPVIATSKDEFKGIYSPDGKSIAYLEERNIIKVYNIESKKSITVSPEGLNYSYVDGDQYFVWSPDSQYLLISSGEGHSADKNGILLKADGSGGRIKVTQSGFGIDAPLWGMNGKIIYYLSEKNGLKVLSQGSEQQDIYAIFLDGSAYGNFKLSKEELSLQKEMKKRDSLARNKTSPPAKNNIVPTKLSNNLDPDLLASRTIRLTGVSAELEDAKLSPDGEKLYLLAKYEKSYDLWVTDLRSRDNKLLTKLDAHGGDLTISKDGKNVFVLADGNIFKVDAETGNKSAININATINLDEDGERAYIFEHAFDYLPKKFFDPKLQGVDWIYYHELYKQFLPHVNNNYDFQILLSEFLGELNSSHTGANYNPSFPNKDETAALGLLYDQSQSTDGLLVNDVLKGGPFDNANSNMKKGCVIDQIDEISITNKADWASLLNHKSGKYTLISFHNPKTNSAYQEVVKPVNIKTETNVLLYDRWIHLMEHLTDSLSGGQVGYLHIREMDEESLRETIDKLDGENRGKKAIIIDTRFNPGGNLHDQLTDLLTEKTKLTVRPQGHTLVHDNLSNGSRKPSCVLMNEGNYSDGFNFPYQYKRLGIGKLIGTPVAGTGTGVYWERQIDNTLNIGIPMLGLSWTGEDTLLENHQLEPDIKVYNSYNASLNGHDEQLEAAVKEMLKTIKEN